MILGTLHDACKIRITWPLGTYLSLELGGSVADFELAVEDESGEREFLSWQAELGAKEYLGWPAPGQSHEAHACFEVTVAGQDAECAQHPVNARLLFLRSDLVAILAGILPKLFDFELPPDSLPQAHTCCLICADVQHQGEADLFPGKGGELWASLWQEA